MMSVNTMSKSLKEIQIDEKIDRIIDNVDSIADNLRDVNDILNNQLDLDDGYTQEQVRNISDYIKQINDDLDNEGVNNTIDNLYGTGYDLSQSEYVFIASDDVRDALREYDEMTKQKMFDDVDKQLSKELTKL